MSPTSLALMLLLAAPDGGAPPSTEPAEFIADVKLLFDVVSCEGAALPENLDAKVVAAWCVGQKPRYQRFKEHWGATAQPFLKSLQPPTLPPELVYPFGGGDLMMALATFPQAQVITTLSLELAGDPRRLAKLKNGAGLKVSLDAVGQASASTLMSNDSKSVNLSKIQQGELPGQLSMHLMGLMLAGMQPVSVRYFRVEPEGTLHYYTQAEIDGLEGQTASKLNAKWKSPDFSPAFANVEVKFTPSGQSGQAPRVFRHIGADLSNAGLTANPGLLKHLQGKGKVALMTKAASYLMWNDAFSTIRSYVVDHATYMVCDSTCPPPRFWKKAGCSVKTYGSFEKSFLGTWEGFQQELRDEYAAQLARALPMRFGYPDGSPEKRSHLLSITCPTAP